MNTFSHLNLGSAPSLSEVNSGSEPVPAGEYVAMIAKVEFGETQNHAPRVSVNFQITEGPHANRLIFEGGIVYDATGNAEFAVKKTAALLAAISRASGIDPATLDEHKLQSLIGREYNIKVGIRGASKDGRYPARNVISGIEAKSMPQSAPIHAPPQPQIAQQPQTFAPPPQQAPTSWANAGPQVAQPSVSPTPPPMSNQLSQPSGYGSPPPQPTSAPPHQPTPQPSSGWKSLAT